MNLLKNRQGSAIIWAPVILLVLMTFFASLFEYSRLNSVAANTNDAVQAALTQVCTDNSKQVYAGVREGYSGGYKLESTDWTSDVTSSNILTKVDAKLGTSGGVKTSDGKLEYRISDLSVDVENAPLAPSDSDSAEQLTGSATYTLTVPLSFGWSALPPMTIHMEAKSGYSQQGDLRGSDDSGSDTGTQVAGISLSESAMTLCRGDTDVLAASVIPDDATDRSISWASADNAVCSVTQSGVITGVDKGSTTVMAISGSGKMAQCDVTVISPVTGVSLDKNSISMIPGATEQLTATVLPSDADSNSVSWVSSDPSVCTVDQSGKVTAVGAGQSTITVMTQEGGYYAECVVKVTIPVTGITMDKTAMTIAKGAADTLTAVVWPDNATRQDVLWASSDSSVCTVDQSGNIAAVGVGPAVISATTEDGQYVATCMINVVIPVTGISVSPATMELIKGTTGTVTATVFPSDATDKTVFWTSTDSNIASVDSSGTVSANNVGVATITARTEDGGYTVACAVTVKPNTYTVTAIANDGGFVSGGGVYAAGTVATLIANANPYYEFLCWSDGSLAQTRRITVTQNITLTASFKSLFTIEDNGDGTCAVTGFDANVNMPYVDIPEYINGLEVVSLEGQNYTGVFENNSSVVSVTIPNSATSIGNYAFYLCNSLTSITIPDSVASIGDYAFAGCESFTNVIIPDSVTSIGEGAFRDCESFTYITIPDSVTSIGDEAFNYCSSLTRITIPDSVTSIGVYAFRLCRSMTSITVDNNNLNYSSQNGILYNRNKRTLITCPAGKTGAVTIPDSVTNIGISAFYYCSSLTNITIPDSVTSVGNNAFYHCSSITNITIPDSVTSIDSYAFTNWGSNQTIYIYGTNYRDWIFNWKGSCYAQIIYE